MEVPLFRSVADGEAQPSQVRQVEWAARGERWCFTVGPLAACA